MPKARLVMRDALRYEPAVRTPQGQKMSAAVTSAIPMPRPGILDIAAYVPGRDHVDGVAKVYKLSSNETPLGPSPKAVAAFEAAAKSLEIYPDGGATALREAIGKRFGIDPARIICGTGSDELLALITHAYLGPGDEGLYSRHGFLVYKIGIMANGGTPVVADETDLTADVDAFIAKLTPKTKIVYLANPNNPTGTYIPFDEVRRLHAALPPHVLLVLDAAYAEYVRANDYASGLELALTAPNVVMTRTFSKIHGLAALRLGWMVGPAHVIDALNRIRGPFNVNAPAIAAGAAAIGDDAHLAAALAHNDEWLPRLTRDLEALGLKVTPSVGNFLLIHFPDTPGKNAQEADAFLASRGLVLRAVKAYELPQCLRATIGTAEANELLVQALREFMGR